MDGKNNTIKFTVIIPTRERCDVFQSALQTVLIQEYDNLEILVSDNHSNDGTREFATGVNDPRVKYVNTGERVSMSQNWEFALSQATGDWVTIIGDDDGLLPGAITRAVDFIRSSGVAAFQTNTCKYRWPGHKGRPFGRLRVPLTKGEERRDSLAWMRKVLDGQAHTDLPMLYTGGFASMAVLSELKRRTGLFYRSRIPDVYSAFAIASLIPQYGYLHSPLCIRGVSQHSIGTDQFSTKQKTRTSPAGKFLLEENLPFHKDLPLTNTGDIPPSLQALVYESYLQTLDLRVNDPEESLEHQLEIILACSSSNGEALTSWSRQFAAMHDLDYEAVHSAARWRQRRNRLTQIKVNFLWRAKQKTIGSKEQKIENVYEASLAADDVLRKSGLR